MPIHAANEKNVLVVFSDITDYSLFLFRIRIFMIIRNIDTSNFEDDRPGAVIAAGDHHTVVVGPALHDGSAQ